MKTKTNMIYVGFATLALACFAVLPEAHAVVPAPDGCYPGFMTAEGCNALGLLTTGVGNTGLGWGSLQSDTSGNFNTGTGAGALLLNNGDSNTAVGAVSLLLNTTGHDNTAVGTDAIVYNDTGVQNTAVGAFALFSNTTESFNTATGFEALFSNTGDGGHNNVATGYQALFSNTTGRRNVAEGNTALYNNTVGNFNVAVGDQALFSLSAVDPNGPANANTAIGWGALYGNTTGGGNTALGHSALINQTAGYQNIALGYVSGQNLVDGNNNIYFSNPAVDTESNTIRIGNVVGFTDIYGFPHAAHTATYMAGINGVTASGGVAVYINSDGQLGTLTSSARFKTEIKPMDESSEAILALKPVTFRYKHEIDPKGIPQFGLVAEDVEKVNPDLVARDEKGRPYSVRYEQVNAMLLNEFLKEHREVQEQKATIAQLKSTVESQEAANARQQKQIEALTAGLQRVSAEVEMDRSAPQMVAQ